MKSNFVSALVKKFCFSAVAILSLSPLLVSAVNAQTLRTVAFSGDAAPGTSGNFSSISLGSTLAPVINDAGQTAFIANLTGTGVLQSNNLGIWSEGSGSLALVARKGSGAPGTSAGFSNFERLVLNGNSQTAFVGGHTGPGVNATAQGIWSEGSGSLDLVARVGDVASGTSVNFVNFINSPALNSAGQTAFFGNLAGTGVDSSNNIGIWLEGSGSLDLVVRNGDPAPGTGVNFIGINPFASPPLNSTGQTAFVSALTGTGINGSNNRGIWSGGRGSITLVVRAGDAAPGTNANFLNSFGPPSLNNTGQTAFRGQLSQPGGGGVTGNSGIWSEGSGSLDLVARTGDPAPGTGVSFGGFANDPVINRAGQTAFIASLSGAGVVAENGVGIWSEGGGLLDLVARAGDPAPGTDKDFSSDFVNLNRMVFNSAGQVAFLGQLTGSGVTLSNDNGIWAQDMSGVLTLIAREGDLLDVDDGPGTDFRTIADLNFGDLNGNSPVYTNNEDGRASGFNNLGQTVFRATFTDGSSGIFVSNQAAIPEPSTTVLMISALFGLCLRKTRFMHPRRSNAN